APGQLAELAEQGLVDREAGRGLGRAQAHHQVQLAALHPRGDAFAQQRLQRAQLFGKAQAGLEEAVVDRAQFAGKRAPESAAFAAGEGGHAADHVGIRLWLTFSSASSSEATTNSSP